MSGRLGGDPGRLWPPPRRPDDGELAGGTVTGTEPLRESSGTGTDVREEEAAQVMETPRSSGGRAPSRGLRGGHDRAVWIDPPMAWSIHAARSGRGGGVASATSPSRHPRRPRHLCHGDARRAPPVTDPTPRGAPPVTYPRPSPAPRAVPPRPGRLGGGHSLPGPPPRRPRPYPSLDPRPSTPTPPRPSSVPAPTAPPARSSFGPAGGPKDDRGRGNGRESGCGRGRGRGRGRGPGAGGGGVGSTIRLSARAGRSAGEVPA